MAGASLLPRMLDLITLAALFACAAPGAGGGMGDAPREGFNCTPDSCAWRLFCDALAPALAPLAVAAADAEDAPRDVPSACSSSSSSSSPSPICCRSVSEWLALSRPPNFAPGAGEGSAVMSSLMPAYCMISENISCLHSVKGTIITERS